MEKISKIPLSPKESEIKLKLIDIYPSINELISQQNNLDIIFQGLDIFYNLYELLENQTEITLNPRNKLSLIISLIKSNNIFATCVYNIKQGEQWITFTYENKKKKESTLVHNLIDCIKIKINCDIKNGNSFFNLKLKKNYDLKNNNSAKQNTNYSTLTTEVNIQASSFIEQILNNKKNKSIKGNKNSNMDLSVKKKFSEKSKNSYIKYENSFNNEFNTSNNVIKGENIINKKKHFSKEFNNNNSKDINSLIKKINENSNNKIINDLNVSQKIKKNNIISNFENIKQNKKIYNAHNKDNRSFNKLDFDTNKKSTKKSILNNNFKNIKNQFNENKLSPEMFISNISNININTNNYEVNIGKNENIKNKNKGNIESIYITGAQIGTFTNRRQKGSNKCLKSNEFNINSINSKTPQIFKNNNFKNNKKGTKIEINKNNKNKNNECSPYTYRNGNENENELSSDYVGESDDNNNNDNEDINNKSSSEDTFEINNFNKLMDDFILLYNDNYIKNVQEELLKLEVELFIEKMCGLILAYNSDINELKMKNKIMKNNLKKNLDKYFIFKKLHYKLKVLRKKYKQKKEYLNKNKMNIKTINDKQFYTNKNEINLFNLVFPFKNNEKKKSENNIKENNSELKKIINIILSNPKNKNISLNQDLNAKWLEINKENNNNNRIYKYSKPIARKKIIPISHRAKVNSNGILNRNNSDKYILNNNNEDESSNTMKLEINNTTTEVNDKNLYVPHNFYKKKILK